VVVSPRMELHPDRRDTSSKKTKLCVLMARYSNSVVVGPGCQPRLVMISKEQFEISTAGYYVWQTTGK
jgi:hypothetical protein